MTPNDARRNSCNHAFFFLAILCQLASGLGLLQQAGAELGSCEIGKSWGVENRNNDKRRETDS